MTRQFAPRGHVFARALLAAVLLVFAALCGCSKKDAGGAEGPVAAKVNGHAIRETEVAQELGQMSQMMQQQGGQVPTDPAGMQTMRENAVNNLIDKQLLLEQAVKEGLAPTDDEVKAEIAKVKAQYPDEAAFFQRLQALSLSEEDLSQEISFNMAMQRLAAKHHDAAPDASIEEAQKYYDENRQQFIEPEGIRASHILIRLNPADSDSAKNAARARAEAALAEVKGGRDFAAVAKERSEDPGSAPGGGDVQFFARGRMVPEFEQAAFALQVGEVSPIVQTQFGLHIIKVTDKRTTREVPFAEVQEKVVQMLGQTKNERVVRALIQEARKTAKIEITPAGAAG